jgi:5'-3' exonuclease
MTTNLIDFNNLAVRTYCNKEIESDTENPNVSLWKYFTIDSIYKSLFKGDVNEIILAVDDRKSWRKLYWERYKESRKGKRDTSKINWDVFHSEYRNFTDEIQHHLPFKILQVENAEADDIIGVLALKDNKEYVVISNDEDYLQLVSDRVKLYNPQKMMFMECPDTEEFIVMKSLMGQSKDDIFNIKTPLDWPQGKRKPGFGEVSARKVIEEGYIGWLEKNNLVERFKINRTLIDFNLIPNTIKTRILNEYNNYKLADPSNIYKFFSKNKFVGYLEDFSNVETKLLELY